MADIQPMEQFLVHKVVALPPIPVPGLGLLDLSITNSVMFMILAATLVTVFFLATARRAVVPGRGQALAEMFYSGIEGMLTAPIIGARGKAFLPFVFTLFLFIAFMNLLGLTPGGFTPTSQLAVTGTLAVMTFSTVIIVGFLRNGIGFFKLFWPSGLAFPIAAFICLIEIISFVIRPVTLAMRLFGNMLGGHVVTYMFASFVVAMGVFAATGAGIAKLGFLGSAVSFAMIVALLTLEFVVAFLQAFVFAALTCVYLNEVVNLDHGH